MHVVCTCVSKDQLNYDLIFKLIWHEGSLSSNTSEQ